jgi:hypothetical protein
MDLSLISSGVLAAIEYSFAYMLLGGGIVGAVAIYVVAKALGR